MHAGLPPLAPPRFDVSFDVAPEVGGWGGGTQRLSYDSSPAYAQMMRAYKTYQRCSRLLTTPTPSSTLAPPRVTVLPSLAPPGRGASCRARGGAAWRGARGGLPRPHRLLLTRGALWGAAGGSAVRGCSWGRGCLGQSATAGYYSPEEPFGGRLVAARRGCASASCRLRGAGACESVGSICTPCRCAGGLCLTGTRLTRPYTRRRPISLPRLLTPPGAERPMIHCEVDIAGSGMRYSPGDAVGLLPEARTHTVAALAIAALPVVRLKHGRAWRAPERVQTLNSSRPLADARIRKCPRAHT